MKNDRIVLVSQKAPQAVGPYSQGVSVGSLIFASGQIGLDPATGALVPGGIKEQTEQALKNVGAVLNAARVSYSEVVKVTIYMQALSDFDAMNEIYKRYFSGSYPARSTIQAAALPKGALIEIEAVAARRDNHGLAI